MAAPILTNAERATETIPNSNAGLSQMRAPKQTLGSEISQIQNPDIQTKNNNTVMPTPVRWKVLKGLLSGYDEEETDYLINGFRYGLELIFMGKETIL
jgi:hypothetical protein